MCLTATKRKRKMVSKHYNNRRYARENFIKEHLGGDGNLVDSFVINRFHRDGEEIHEIRDNGLIIIYNKNTGRLITKLIARRSQIKRYYKNSNKTPPQRLLDLAEYHESLGYHYI